MPADGAPRAPDAGDDGDAPRSTGSRATRRMRMHTALHLLSAVLPYPVTGGSVGEADSRLDFDIPDAGLDKDAITAQLAEMIAADAEVREPLDHATPNSKPIRASSRPCR